MADIAGLRALAGDLVTVTDDRPDLAERAQRVLERIDRGSFHIAVLGEFKRGKSTLVNALLGAHVLPTGVVPVTAIATEVARGEPAVVVHTSDGARTGLGVDTLAEYATEAGNPHNVRGVRRIEVRWPSPLLEPGLVLVDTPGVGSIHAHNTEAGEAARSAADGAVVVLGADEPLSDRELALLAELDERGMRTFVVVNKADHLDPAERQQVRAFIADRCRATLGWAPRLYLVDARRAASIDGAAAEATDEPLDWAAFRTDLDDFVTHDLVAAHSAAAARELSRIATELRERITLEAAASELDRLDLETRTLALREAANRALAVLDEDRALLERDVRRIVTRCGERLHAFAAAEAARATPELARLAEQLPTATLDNELRRAIDRIVRSRFEAGRVDEADRVGGEWAHAAARARRRVEDEINAVRAIASDLFRLPLGDTTIPPFASEDDRFTYLFVRVGSTNEPFLRAASRLLPPPLARRRTLARATAELAREFDKHAGRARWDVEQRLQAARHGLEAHLADETARAVTAILEAAHRAEGRLDLSLAERRRRSEQDAYALAVTEQVLHLANGHR